VVRKSPPGLRPHTCWSWLIEPRRRRGCSTRSGPAPAAPPATSHCWCRGPTGTPDTEETAATLELALPLLDEAAGSHVEGIIGDTDPFLAVEQALEGGSFDEIIISTLPARVSHWLRRDLPHRVERFGLPVTVVTAKQSERAPSAAG
jgi:hypothetical protein